MHSYDATVSCDSHRSGHLCWIYHEDSGKHFDDIVC